MKRKKKDLLSSEFSKFGQEPNKEWNLPTGILEDIHTHTYV